MGKLARKPLADRCRVLGIVCAFCDRPGSSTFLAGWPDTQGMTLDELNMLARVVRFELRRGSAAVFAVLSL
jgi:hypothetical protein